MTPREYRYALAESLRSGLGETYPSTWTVYAGPAESVNAPCIVILPDETYREASGWGTSELVSLSLSLLLPRAASTSGIDELDDVASVVQAIIRKSTPGGSTIRVHGLGAVMTISASEYITCTLSVQQTVDNAT